MRQRRKAGQSTLEYSILFAVIAAVLIVMAIWYKRAGMGRIRQSADSLGSQFDIETSTGADTSTYNSTTTEARAADGTTTTTLGTVTQTQDGTTTTDVITGKKLF